MGFLGRGQLVTLPTSYMVSESGVSFPSGVRAADVDFWMFLIPQKASSTTIVGSNGINKFDGKNYGDRGLRARNSED